MVSFGQFEAISHFQFIEPEQIQIVFSFYCKFVFIASLVENSIA